VCLFVEHFNQSWGLQWNSIDIWRSLKLYCYVVLRRTKHVKNISWIFTECTGWRNKGGWRYRPPTIFLAMSSCSETPQKTVKRKFCIESMFCQSIQEWLENQKTNITSQVKSTDFHSSVNFWTYFRKHSSSVEVWIQSWNIFPFKIVKNRKYNFLYAVVVGPCWRMFMSSYLLLNSKANGRQGCVRRFKRNRY